MRSLWVVLGVGLGACGPGWVTPTVTPPPSKVRAGVPPPSDEVALRKMLTGEVTNGGLWFVDPTCLAQFGRPGTIALDAFDAFAHCVAGLRLHPSGRDDARDDTSVLTDDAGFEVEAHVVAGRLDFIGFSGRWPGARDLPMITPEALELLRAGGDPNATISDELADKHVARPKNVAPTHTHNIRLCLGDAGEITAIAPASTTSPELAAAFAAVARGWSFRPFVVGGKPVAACAVVALHYPATKEGTRARFPRPPQRSQAGHAVYIVNPQQLEQLRVSGSKDIAPDDADKVHRNGQRLIGSFKLCLDETGHYESGVMLKSTGLPGYDAKLARTMMGWVYRPFVVDGVASPVCTAFTFVYLQR